MDGIEHRLIRLFVSSTFRDMKLEREELCKRVFPELRKFCADRGVEFVDVDLRWGIPREEDVLESCLAEVRACHPFFVGVLGERYGWVPGAVPSDLLPVGLAADQARSITDLEILTRLGQQPEHLDQAFFYFRHREASASGRETQAARRRQRSLKHLIRMHCRPLRKDGATLRTGYRDARTLGDWVMRDLTRSIDRLFPLGAAPDPWQQEFYEHEAFAEGRRRLFVGRSDDLAKLDAHADAGGPPLVVTGEAGVGKSALLAVWTHRYRQRHPDALVIAHHIGGAARSADWSEVVRRTLMELAAQGLVKGPIPTKPEELRHALDQPLREAAAQRRVVWVLDGLNQLEDRDAAPDLGFLPEDLPPGVSLIVSTLPGRPLTETRRRMWEECAVGPLQVEDRRQVIVAHLARYGKELRPKLQDRIATAPPTANPLFLRVLLDELRLHGRHETLAGVLDQYLAAGTVPALYDRILARWERDYECDRRHLVRDACTFLWASRHGLTENEWRTLLGTDGQQLPAAHFSPFFRAAEAALINRSGLYSFFHDDLRQAVELRYLKSEEAKRRAHRWLASLFVGSADALADPTPRMLDELPWHFTRAGSWSRLYRFLTQPHLLLALWRRSELDTRRYWSKMEAASAYRMATGFGRVRLHGAKQSEVYVMALLLYDFGHAPEALRLLEHLRARNRQQDPTPAAVAVLRLHSLILRRQRRLTEALEMLQAEAAICRALRDDDLLQSSLGTQALVLDDLGQSDAALEMHRQEEAICRRIGHWAGLQASLGNQGVILRRQGYERAALEKWQEQERICRRTGNQYGLQASLGNQARLLGNWDRLTEALELHREEEAISRNIGDRNALQSCLNNLAMVLFRLGHTADAMAYLREQEGICVQSDLPLGLQSSLANQAYIHRKMNRNTEALQCLRLQQRICERYRLTLDWTRCLVRQAFILREMGEAAEAQRLARMARDAAKAQHQYDVASLAEQVLGEVEES
ncbi:MAG TPA: AAA family ATPase [Symbiobacteriaceae bacterium]|nr:AAA family ATPase [Symbiobacteriaceae bacterium]